MKIYECVKCLQLHSEPVQTCKKCGHTEIEPRDVNFKSFLMSLSLLAFFVLGVYTAVKWVAVNYITHIKF